QLNRNPFAAADDSGPGQFAAPRLLQHRFKARAKLVASRGVRLACASEYGRGTGRDTCGNAAEDARERASEFLVVLREIGLLSTPIRVRCTTSGRNRVKRAT